MGSRTTLLHSGPTGSMRHVELKLRPQICYQTGCMQTLHARLRTVAVGLPIRAPPASPGYGLRKNLKQAITKADALPPGIEHLLEDSALPILKICGMSGVGAYCARQGMIDVAARRTLSKLAINVFTPALMISKLGAHISIQEALTLWPIGANVITCHLAGLAVGVAHTNILNTPPSLSRIIRVSTAISNVGNLPLVMVMSFVKNPNLPFNTAAEADMAVSYVMLGWFYATMIQMPLGYWLLQKMPDAADVADNSTGLQRQVQQAPGPSADVSTSAAVDDAPAGLLLERMRLEMVWQLRQTHSPAEATSTSVPLLTAAAAAAAVAGGSVGMGATYSVSTAGPDPSAVNRPLQHFCDLSLKVPDALPYLGDKSSSSSSSGSAVVSSSRDDASDIVVGKPRLSACAPSRQQDQAFWQPMLKGLVSAPLLAGLVAIGIGSCPPLRDALFGPGGSLSLIGDCVDMLGQPLIPVLLLVLGANLADGPGGAQLPWRSVAGVVASRLMLLPAVGCVSVLTAQHTGVINMQDPLTLVVMMVSWSTPTAILVHSLASVHQNGEDEVSALLFWEYLACILTLPLCSATYLYLLGCCMKYVA